MSTITEQRRSLADKLNLTKGGGPSEDAETLLTEEFADDGVYRPFIILRQSIGRADMLNLKFKNQRQRSFEYSHLYGMEYTPSEGKIQLTFSEHEIAILGFKLADGYHHLLVHRVMQIAEADSPTAKLLIHKSNEAVITEIHISERTIAPHSYSQPIAVNGLSSTKS